MPFGAIAGFCKRQNQGNAGQPQDSMSCRETGVARGSPENSVFMPGFRNFANTVLGIVTWKSLPA